MPVTAIEAAYFPQDNVSVFTSSHYLYQQKLIQYIANCQFKIICFHLHSFVLYSTSEGGV